MKHTPRLFRATVATVAAAAVATMATVPAQASDDAPVFERQKTERTFDAPLAGDTARAESAAGSTGAEVWRIAGATRIETAIMASQAAWPDADPESGPAVMAVVLTRHDDYADALGGSALAGAASGPLLMTSPATLHPGVRAEIDRVLGGTGVVYILGGSAAVSVATETTLKDAGYRVERLAGMDRYSTSVKVAQKVSAWIAPDGKPHFVMATTGQDFPDGLAAGATAGGLAATVVLTKGSTVPTVVSDYLYWRQKEGVPVYTVGGQAAASPITGDTPIVGKDRFETAAMVADLFWGTSPDLAPVAIGLATGLNWPDALAGGAFMAGGGPLMLTRTNELPTPTEAVTQSLYHLWDPSSVEFGFVFGGESVVGPNAADHFAFLLGNTAG